MSHRYWPVTAAEEARIAELLQLVATGVCRIKDIERRTNRRYATLMHIAAKFNISVRPKKKS